MQLSCILWLVHCFNGFTWFLVVVHGYSGISGYTWLLMVLVVIHGYTWLLIVIDGYSYMVIHDY